MVREKPQGKAQPTPRFHLSPFYEQMARIMRNDPKRFFLFSPSSKRALAIYLEMKSRAIVSKGARDRAGRWLMLGTYLVQREAA